MRLTPDDALCIPVPLYHCFGMVLGNLAAVSYGAKMVFPGEGFDPLATLKAVQAKAAPRLHGVPTMFAAMLEHPSLPALICAACAPGSWPDPSARPR